MNHMLGLSLSLMKMLDTFTFKEQDYILKQKHLSSTFCAQSAYFRVSYHKPIFSSSRKVTPFIFTSSVGDTFYFYLLFVMKCMS